MALCFWCHGPVLSNVCLWPRLCQKSRRKKSVVIHIFKRYENVSWVVFVLQFQALSRSSVVCCPTGIKIERLLTQPRPKADIRTESKSVFLNVRFGENGVEKVRISKRVNFHQMANLLIMPCKTRIGLYHRFQGVRSLISSAPVSEVGSLL